MVTNLNKMDFNTSMISEEYYYKKYGFKTLSLKKEIEQGIKNKFNQTSDILDSFGWNQEDLTNNDDRYFFYTMLYREFEYNNKFSVLKNDKFGNYDMVNQGWKYNIHAENGQVVSPLKINIISMFNLKSFKTFFSKFYTCPFCVHCSQCCYIIFLIQRRKINFISSKLFNSFD